MQQQSHTEESGRITLRRVLVNYLENLDQQTEEINTEREMIQHWLEAPVLGKEKYIERVDLKKTNGFSHADVQVGDRPVDVDTQGPTMDMLSKKFDERVATNKLTYITNYLQISGPSQLKDIARGFSEAFGSDFKRSREAVYYYLKHHSDTFMSKERGIYQLSTSANHSKKKG